MTEVLIEPRPRVPLFALPSTCASLLSSIRRVRSPSSCFLRRGFLPLACKRTKYVDLPSESRRTPSSKVEVFAARDSGWTETGRGQKRTWENSFLELKDFQKEQGHTSVPRSSGLYKWSIRQRAAWKSGSLSTERYRQLSAINFQWDLKFEKWKAMFYRLVAFEQMHGHCNVTLRVGDPECDIQLARWVVKQRFLWKEGSLPDDRRRRLWGIGFSFTPDDDIFRDRLTQLRVWREQHGHANIPRSWAEDPGLARWADSVRLRWRQGKLSFQYFRELRELGFSFAPQKVSWESQLHDLQQFSRTRGHCNPAFIENARLHSWLALQRRRHANGSLSRRRAAQLHAIGVDLRPHPVVFQERLRQLSKVYRSTGVATPPLSDHRLAQWVAQIRAQGRARISRANLKKLDAIQFSFEAPKPVDKDCMGRAGELPNL